MAYLTKEQTKELKDWKESIIDDNNEIQIAMIDGNGERYISIYLVDEDGDMVESIDLDKEYEERKEMEKDSKKIRQEIKRKLDMNKKMKYEIIDSEF